MKGARISSSGVNEWPAAHVPTGSTIRPSSIEPPESARGEAGEARLMLKMSEGGRKVLRSSIQGLGMSTGAEQTHDSVTQMERYKEYRRHSSRSKTKGSQ